MERLMSLEEMIVNAVLNPEKKFTHIYWKENEYIYWKKTSRAHSFEDESGEVFELWEYSTYLSGWKEWK